MKTTIFAIAASIIVTSPNLMLAQDTTPEDVIILPGDEGGPAEVAKFLNDKRAVVDLSDDELKARIREGRALAKKEGVSRKQRQQIVASTKQAASELLRRQQAQTEQPADPEQPKPEEPVATVEQPQNEQLADPEQPKPEESVAAVEQPQSEQPPDVEQPKSEEPVAAVEQPQTGEPKSQAEQQQVKELDGNKASPEAEAKAKEFLEGGRSADQLNDEELRKRLEAMRALLGGNELSSESEKALRRQLRTEREILRTRIAAKVEAEEKVKQEKQRDETANQDGNQGKQGRDRGDKRRWDDWAADDVLRDRRASDTLEEGELRRRIDVYRDAINDERYDENNRRYWRESMARDRRALRGRMIEDRRARGDDYRRRRAQGGLDFDIDINVNLDGDSPEAMFADEIDDEQLEEQLAAAPRREIKRRYTVQEIEDDPEIRLAMPAIEIDTVRFGFNEAFVREEEIENLDRIAAVVEKILAVHPGEVFMIEGHTDAVGSDEYNLRLSRQRAQAVKEALSTFYVIPSRNLETAGYGERYLKIPTAEPEQENRRVTLRRVTPLVGEMLED